MLLHILGVLSLNRKETVSECCQNAWVMLLLTSEMGLALECGRDWMVEALRVEKRD